MCEKQMSKRNNGRQMVASHKISQCAMPGCINESSTENIPKASKIG